LVATIANQPLEAIAGRDPKVSQVFGRMYLLQLPQGRALHEPVDTSDIPFVPDALGVFVPERSDHRYTL